MSCSIIKRRFHVHGGQRLGDHQSRPRRRPVTGHWVAEAPEPQRGQRTSDSDPYESCMSLDKMRNRLDENSQL
jgi:hypothetical protein